MTLQALLERRDKIAKEREGLMRAYERLTADLNANGGALQLLDQLIALETGQHGEGKDDGQGTKIIPGSEV